MQNVKVEKEKDWRMEGRKKGVKESRAKDFNSKSSAVNRRLVSYDDTCVCR